ncbi:MAG: MoxR family ATPase [Deltaproteobacteria bacterium]|nr:MoxR family ATPase [Deltaproteobacteria bacterium]
MDFVEAQHLTQQLRDKIGRVVIGQEAVVEGLLVALLSGGHALLEGPPGSAKTLLARSFASCLGLIFNRVQFTPDLMPGDLIGTNLYNFQTNAFTLTRGPIFTDFLLADEINRTPPKTQAALLQAMQERTVTLDGKNHTLSESFLVVATQNPIEHEGTYPLPEAQLDRFLLKIEVPYPQRDDEIEVVRLHGHRSTMPNLADFDLAPVANLESLRELRQLVQTVTLSEEMVVYIVDLVRATREHPSILHGASPRAATMLATAARSLATLRGREFAIPDDIKELFLPALHHRVILAPSAEVEGQTPDGVLKLVLESVAAPR